MNNKRLIISILSLSCMFINPSYAYKILWTKEAITPGAEGHIERNIIQSPSNLKWNSSEVDVKDFEGKKNIPVIETATHGVHIYNELHRKNRYKFYYELSCLKKAYQFWGEVELNPIERYDEIAKSSLTIQESRRGIYNISAKTRVSGEKLKIAKKHAKLRITS